jgi:hypothetical protein
MLAASVDDEQVWTAFLGSSMLSAPVRLIYLISGRDRTLRGQIAGQNDLQTTE